MRISDWSSDVCSSDLAGCGVGNLARRIEEGAGPDQHLDRISSAIAGLVSSYSADGYDLRIFDFDGRHLHLAIDAHEGSCAECRVPQAMTIGLVRTKLPADLADVSITIDYPAIH